MNQDEKIDWNRFETGGYIRLEPDQEKRLVLTQWRIGAWFGRQGLSFQVDAEDGAPVSKQFTTTSRRLISTLKPIIQKAEGEHRETIRVAITRFSEGYDTSYRVRDLPLVEEEVVSDG